MKETLHAAMKYLSACCDGAIEEDGVGFTKGDSYNGKFLASLPVKEWTDAHDSLAHYFAQKYRGQIRHIIDLEPRYEREFPTEDAREVTEDRRRSFPGSISATALNHAELRGDRIVIFSPYNPRFVEESRKIPSRRWDSSNKSTTFSVADVQEVFKLCDMFNIEVKFDLSDVPKLAPVIKPPPPVAVKKQVVIEGKKLVIYFPYDAAIVARIKDLGVASWNKDKKCWTVDAIHAQRVVDSLEPHGFEIDPTIRSLAHQSIQNQENYNLADTQYRIDIPQILPEYVVLPHQWVPIEWAVKNNHILNADSQGLGKTFVSLTTLVIKDSQRTVVVAPASLTENWKNESQMFYVDGTFTPFMAEGRKPGKIPDDANLVILSWDVFTFWEDALNAWKPDAIIVDEAHYGKSGKGSNRGKTYIEFGKANPGALKMALTGTPILNRPLELLASLQFFGIEKMFGGITKFKNRYCDPRVISTPYGDAYTFNGATNLKELHSILTASGVYVRRTKKLLMEQGILKSKYVNGVEFFQYETPRTPTHLRLTPDEKNAYLAVEGNFKQSLKDKQAELAKEMGLGFNHPKVVNAMASNKGGQALALLSEFRKSIGLLKVRATIEYVKELISKGEKVVIFAHHREVVDSYAAAFSGIKIQGGMGSKKIEEAKRKFNATSIEEHPVLVVSIEAGKTGHTLCLQKKYGVGKNCRHAIFAEEPYVYGDAEQAEDRIYRIGQDREVFIDNLLVAGTVDEVIYGIRERKRKVFNAIIDGVNLEDDDEDSVARQILQGYI